MKLLRVLTVVAFLVVSCPLAFASDADTTVAATVDLGSRFNEAVTNLVTGVISPVMGFGWTMLAIFGAYALLQTQLSSTVRSLSYHHYVPAATILPIVAVLLRVLVAGLMLKAYTPFHQIFPNVANGLTKTVSMAELTQVFSFLNDIANKLPPVGVLQVMPALISVLVLAFAAAASFGLTIMTSMSHAVIGVLTIVGPLMIPFYVLPGFDKKFWNWIDNMLAYSMYRFVAACFAYLWAHVYIALLAAITVYSVGSWVVAIGSFIIVTVSCVFTAFKVPEITHMIFGGVGGLASSLSNTFQNAALRGVSKLLR